MADVPPSTPKESADSSDEVEGQEGLSCVLSGVSTAYHGNVMNAMFDWWKETAVNEALTMAI